MIDIDQPQIVEFLDPLVKVGIADPHPHLCGIIEHPRREGRVRILEREVGDVGEQVQFLLVQRLHRGFQVHVLRGLERRFHVLTAHRHEPFPLRIQGCSPDQVQPDPEVSAGHCLVHDVF